jgi:hypothetical protein
LPQPPSRRFGIPEKWMMLVQVYAKFWFVKNQNGLYRHDIRRPMKPLVSYVRVSTSQQARSGLGIEAQREGLARFAETEGFEIFAEFVEVETGKGSDALDRRPQLSAALAKARSVRCPVAVGKLDRLSRDVHFIYCSSRSSASVTNAAPLS